MWCVRGCSIIFILLNELELVKQLGINCKEKVGIIGRFLRKTREREREDLNLYFLNHPIKPDERG